MKIRRRSLLAGGLFFVLIFTVFLTLPLRSSETVPSFHDVRAAYRPSDVPLLDRHGVIVHELRTDVQSRRFAWSPLAEISPAVLQSVLASEDRRFFAHQGVDWWGLLGVMGRTLTGASLRGASTITMQVATLLENRQEAERLSRLRRRSTAWNAVWNKWRQMQHAWALEKSWSKAEILETYLNLVSFRGELEGITAAAYLLFDKAPHGVTGAEATILAVMLRSPNASLSLLLRRAERLRNVQADLASREEILKAAALAVRAPVSFSERISLAPHVARRVLSDPGQAAPVRSTLDSRAQRFAIETLHRQLLAVREQRVDDGAVLVVDNATGEVLAYVGGSGALSSATYVDGVRARRQAGSTLKPFLYGLALDARVLTPASLLDDAPLDLAVAGGVYRPQNYDEQFKGLISVRTALASSLNVPAVKTLALVGADAFSQKLHALGFQSIAEAGEFYGPSLALGSVDVNLWELVNAYRTLANGGSWGPLRLVRDETSEAQSFPTEQQERLYSEAAAFLLSHILSDRESRSLTFGLENPLATPFWSAVKTGTSKDMRDNWCIGYSSRYTVGVWVGNFSGAPMKNVSGVTGAAPVWAEIMSWLHRTTASVPPRPPHNVVVQSIAFPRGVESGRDEWFLQGTEPYGASRELAHAPAHIRTPVDGVVIALDPDIPSSRQRVTFEAQSGQSPFSWVLDGMSLGPAATPFLWEPQPGRHTLTLNDAQGRPVEVVRFVVRGRFVQDVGRTESDR